MPIVSDAAVVLRRLDYSETSQILVLFTRDHGKVRAIAKGVKRSTKKQFAPGIDLLEFGSVLLALHAERPDSLATLTEWKQTLPLAGLRERLPRFHAALYVSEITAGLTEDYDPHPGLHDALTAALVEIDCADDVIDPLVRYQRALLTAAGSWPEFHACVRCRRTAALTHFSALQGGMLCGTCEPKQHEKRRVTTATHAVLAATGQELAPPGPAPEGAFALLNYHIAHLLGHEPQLGHHLLAPQRRRRANR